MDKSYSYFLVFLLLSFYSCSSSKKIPLTQPEISFIDSLSQPNQPEYWSKPEYRSPLLTWDLIHQRVLVKLYPELHRATITTDLFLRNKQISQNIIFLDAMGFEPDSIINLKTGQELSATVDSALWKIRLLKPAAKDDTVIIRISYRLENPYSGLHFVNTDSWYDNQPLQIWTQNQPDQLHFWLPSLDQPAIRSSLELWLDVPDSLETIATGIVLEKKETEKGRRMDYWRLQQKQAPYLWGFVVGQFDESQIRFGKKLLHFYSDKGYRKYHPLIYSEVPEMLNFMEQFTGKSYPFDALRFVPIHEFDSGGMENTGMITLFDGVQFDSTASLDLNNTALLMHEIAHHWYGNTVTVNDWGSVALQEGVAMFFEIEYLRYREKYQKALDDKWQQWNTYLSDANYQRRPIITKNYSDPSELFDSHTYEKAALVFDYLRSLLGDDVFRSIMTEWLDTNPELVSLSQFQKIAEEQSGKSLTRFFNEWFLQAGHPKISVQLTQNNQETFIRLKQVQNLKKEPSFELSLPFQLIYADSVQNRILHWTNTDTLLTIPAKVLDIFVDPEFTAPIEIDQPLSSNQLSYRLRPASPFRIKMESLQNKHFHNPDSTIKNALLSLAKDDASVLVKSSAITQLAAFYRTNDRELMANVLQSDEDGRVRIHALYALASDSAKQVDSLLEKQLMQEKSYFVKAEIIKIGLIRNGERWIPKVSAYSDSISYQNLYQAALVQGLQDIQGEESFRLLIKLVQNRSNAAYQFDALATLSAMTLTDSQKEIWIEVLKDKANDQDISIRLLSLQSLKRIPDQDEWIEAFIKTMPPIDQDWYREQIQIKIEG